jgi:hypothetical protein
MLCLTGSGVVPDSGEGEARCLIFHGRSSPFEEKVYRDPR